LLFLVHCGRPFVGPLYEVTLALVRNVRNGSKPAASGPNLGVRFTPESCRDNCRPARQLRAINGLMHCSKKSLFDYLVSESTRVLAPPIAHGTDDRAEVATLCGEDVLGPRGTHRIEAPLDDAILLKRPQALR
jgi:hypothetical protein